MGREEVAKILLLRGADLTIRNKVRFCFAIFIQLLLVLRMQERPRPASSDNQLQTPIHPNRFITLSDKEMTKKWANAIEINCTKIDR
jgi:hypothetical protein